MRSRVPMQFICMITFFSFVGCQPKGPNGGSGSAPIFDLNVTKEGKIAWHHNLLASDARHRSTGEIELGKEGELINYQGEWSLNAKIAWPNAKTSEVTVDFDSGAAKRGMLLTIGLPSHKVTVDGKAVQLHYPATLPLGKYRVVIKTTWP